MSKDAKYLDAAEYTQDNKHLVAHGSWYRGEHCNFHVAKKHREDPLYYDKYVLQGWMPEKPFITKNDYITSFGSCFAAHLTHYLKERGYTVGDVADKSGQTHVVRFGEGMVNVYAILQQLRWGLDDVNFSENLWYGSKGELATYNEETRKATQELFERTNVWIITLGLNEVWYNKKTGEVFWRAIPKSVFDPAVHDFRVLSVGETTTVLIEICRLIQRIRPWSKIIFTLSPVPLVTTFRPVSCITANTVSKAILRVAVDELMQINSASLRRETLFYFPAYEIVHATEDPYATDNRHPKLAVVEKIMQLFEKYFCVVQ